MNQPMQSNGHAHEGEKPEASATARDQLDQLLFPVIGNTVNGLLLTFQGVAHDQLLRSAARVLGTVLARMMVGANLAQTLALRAAIKEDFAKAMDTAGITQNKPSSLIQGRMAENGLRKTQG